ncbi:3-deoxy-D-manno-octulosonic acid transferase [Pseudoponticoccus marisrubri]|uniref:3-deoxy-D-manno-octulosonic acid transferase n=1 Tax=Pseudoponticoccus marisrubri TaxID=1685382 RepID=A0A0W7WQA0_9RHOB|nr:glycosyltransferase N-terminal domain-containing protein [Pseudoponticoccus marisrubri]KUF12748.1 3-deoxy-D-manno-octulosonic acid transferase [Pseudoponticoccus marisrubri]
MPRRALSLQAYLAYARAGTPAPAPPVTRPEGPVVLAHGETPEQARALANMGARLAVMRPEVTLALSGDAPLQPGQIAVTLPEDGAAEAEAFARALRPELLLWAGQHLRPALVDALYRHGTRAIAMDLSDAPLTAPGPRWLPDPVPAVLPAFEMLYANDDAAARRLRRLGSAPQRIQIAGPLLDTAMPLSCPDALHEEIAGLIAGRPVWLAARVPASEAHDVLSAHRRAVRLAHRLLLVLVPADAADSALMAETAAAMQMRVCDWENGEMPDENTQVILTRDDDELGLWYRLAPLVFLAGSLRTGASGQDPFEAASLGSAILYGPHVRRHLPAYGALVEAGAARIVRDADSLGAAVSNLVAPDQIAAMAHAGWDVVSSGAKLVDRVIADCCEMLDAPERA